MKWIFAQWIYPPETFPIWGWIESGKADLHWKIEIQGTIHYVYGWIMPWKVEKVDLRGTYAVCGPPTTKNLPKKYF